MPSPCIFCQCLSPYCKCVKMCGPVGWIVRSHFSEFSLEVKGNDITVRIHAPKGLSGNDTLIVSCVQVHFNYLFNCVCWFVFESDNESVSVWKDQIDTIFPFVGSASPCANLRTEIFLCVDTMFAVNFKLCRLLLCTEHCRFPSFLVILVPFHILCHGMV